MFLFKKKKVTLDCFINVKTIHSLFKIDHAIKFAPKDWKTFPGTIDLKVSEDPKSKLTAPYASIRKCVGLSNLFSKGFIIPSWTDFGLEIMPDGKCIKHDPINNLNIDSHPRFLHWDNLYKNWQHVKIYSPWLLRETSGVQFMWNQCDWHNTDRVDKFHVLSGVVDYKAQHGTHVNVFMKKGSMVQIQAGDPLVHLVPITDKDVDIQCHLIDDQEYRKIYKDYAERSTYSGHHRAMLNVEEKSRCPFRIFSA